MADSDEFDCVLSRHRFAPAPLRIRSLHRRDRGSGPGAGGVRAGVAAVAAVARLRGRGGLAALGRRPARHRFLAPDRSAPGCGSFAPTTPADRPRQVRTSFFSSEHCAHSPWSSAARSRCTTCLTGQSPTSPPRPARAPARSSPGSPAVAPPWPRFSACLITTPRCRWEAPMRADLDELFAAFGAHADVTATGTPEAARRRGQQRRRNRLTAATLVLVLLVSVAVIGGVQLARNVPADSAFSPTFRFVGDAHSRRQSADAVDEDSGSARRRWHGRGRR